MRVTDGEVGGWRESQLLEVSYWLVRDKPGFGLGLPTLTPLACLQQPQEDECHCACLALQPTRMLFQLRFTDDAGCSVDRGSCLWAQRP